MPLAPPSPQPTARVRPPAVAGLFYEGAAEALRRDVTALLDSARAERPDGAPVPKALIAPHAGHVYSGALAARAYARWEPARPRLSRIVLIGPSHRVAFRGLALSGAESWRTPLGAVPVDRAWARERLASVAGEIGVLDRAHAQEHSLEVHLPFLQCLLDDGFSVVPMVAGRVDPDTVAAALDALWGGPETAILISSDLSHFWTRTPAGRAMTPPPPPSRHGQETAASVPMTPAAAPRSTACCGWPSAAPCGWSGWA